MWRRAGHDGDLAGWLDADSRALPAAGGHCLRWTKRADLDVTRHANAHQTACGSGLLLFFAQFLVAGKVESLVERRLVISAVVIQSGSRVKGKLVCRGKIPAADIDGIDLQFSRNDVHRALDDIGRFRPARA